MDSQRQEEYDGDIEAALEVEEDWALKDSLVKEEEKSEESKEEEEANQVEANQEEEKSKEESEESKEESEEEEADQGEGSKRDINNRKSESAEEVIEELRRRLTHEATGPHPVWVPPVRVRTLVPFQNGSITHPAGSIVAVHRMSEVKPGRMVVTLDGKESCLPVRRSTTHTTRHGLPAPTVEILD